MRYRLRTLLVFVIVAPLIVSLPFCCPFVDIGDNFKVQPGMTKEQVVKIVGRPMERSKSFEGGGYWTYYTRPLDVIGGEIVEFDSSGHVVRTWSH